MFSTDLKYNNVMAEFDFRVHDAEVELAFDAVRRAAAFDKFVDLALDGAITVDSAIRGYKEALKADGIPVARSEQA